MQLENSWDVLPEDYIPKMRRAYHTLTQNSVNSPLSINIRTHASSTRSSQAVSHPSTAMAKRTFTPVGTGESNTTYFSYLNTLFHHQVKKIRSCKEITATEVLTLKHFFQALNKSNENEKRNFVRCKFFFYINFCNFCNCKISGKAKPLKWSMVC